MREKKYNEEVLCLTLQGMTQTQISEKVGISRQMVSRYQNDGNFRDELARRKIKAVEAATNKLQYSLSSVAEVAVEIATDKEISPQIRLNAAQIVLSQCRSWTELTDIIHRLDEVEKAVNRNNI